MLKIAWKIRRWVETVMALFLLAMVALTFADVIGRRIVGRPIYGTNDITEHLMALVVFAGLPLVTAAGAHLTIDLFDKLVNKQSMAWWRAIISALVTLILALIAWLFIKHGLNAARISEVSKRCGCRAGHFISTWQQVAPFRRWPAWRSPLAGP